MAEYKNYEGNSHKMKEASLVRPTASTFSSLEKEDQEKERAKIVNGVVKTRKQPISVKIMHALIGGDVGTIKSHVVWDIVLPAVKDTIRNSLVNIVESIFGGSDVATSRSKSFISYNSMYNAKPASNRSSIYDYDEVIFESRSEAEEVLKQLCFSIKKYGYVSILDYYDMVGVRTRSTDANYGWLSLNGYSIERVSGGYLLKLPAAMPID